jgi:superfamily I DNA/RNA helicase
LWSGETTTLIARIAWLVATGVDPAAICAITFNKRAAEELDSRLVDALAPLGRATPSGFGRSMPSVSSCCATRGRSSSRSLTG